LSGSIKWTKVLENLSKLKTIAINTTSTNIQLGL
jgi:hypothetical protein